VVIVGNNGLLSCHNISASHVAESLFVFLLKLNFKTTTTKGQQVGIFTCTDAKQGHNKQKNMK